MITIIALLCALPFILVSTTLAIELAFGAAPARRSAVEQGHQPFSATILIPAHDEERAIRATLDQIRAVAGPRFHTLVVADNCSDATAQIARAAGVEVIERHDVDHRGKGFALAFGRERLAASPPDCVIILDADTSPRTGALEALVSMALDCGAPAQAAYYIEATESSSAMARFSAVSFYVKNVVRQLGLARMGAPAILTGSGMAFPWPNFAALPLETGHVTEDLMLGVESCLDGHAPRFVPNAEIVGQASSDQGTGIQRRRWESGFFDTARNYVPRLLNTTFERMSARLLWLALHLCTPPLLLLLALDCIALVPLAALWLLGESVFPMLALALAAGLLLVMLGIATTLHGYRLRLGDLIAVPGYLLWKLAVSLKALVSRERTWIRTTRE
ncbi:glycosyltransferase family 2 protein [Sphingomonas sp. MG17]|uniref:Glycosyltransferase family 2 protein n=1 Tax=Sphingomonas tagetis TaxID=2949092 RepID=A0A9X2KLH9_9SPHN|nr:glycosyltransferase family 2 protein [Sphingomonas tagetis]MCP3730825.1 glycosyltransferase family 2 protein [Sphingomonas tagetis]